MISYRYVVSDRDGLHARQAMSISRASGDYQSKITLIGEKGKADCKNVLSLMGLNAHQGENLTLEVEGPDEEQAAGFLNGLLRTIL